MTKANSGALQSLRAPEVVRQEMSDGGHAHNVRLRVPGYSMLFACESEFHAYQLRDALEKIAWVDVEDYESNEVVDALLEERQLVVCSECDGVADDAEEYDRMLDDDEGLCDSCRADREADEVLNGGAGIRVLAVVMMCVVVLVAALALFGCSTSPADGRWREGDVVRASHFANYPQYEGESVVVVQGLGWRWIRGDMYQGNALRTYEVETSDGKRLAAQEFQLAPLGQEGAP